MFTCKEKRKKKMQTLIKIMYCIYLTIKQDLFVITKIRRHLTSGSTVCRGKDILGTVACLEIHGDSGSLNLCQETGYPD